MHKTAVKVILDCNTNGLHKHSSLHQIARGDGRELHVPRYNHHQQSVLVRRHWHYDQESTPIPLQMKTAASWELWAQPSPSHKLDWPHWLYLYFTLHRESSQHNQGPPTLVILPSPRAENTKSGKHVPHDSRKVLPCCYQTSRMPRIYSWSPNLPRCGPCTFPVAVTSLLSLLYYLLY